MSCRRRSSTWACSAAATSACRACAFASRGVVRDVPLGARRGAPARDHDRRPQLRRLEQLGRPLDHPRALDEAVRVDEDAGERRPRDRPRPPPPGGGRGLLPRRGGRRVPHGAAAERLPRRGRGPAAERRRGGSARSSSTAPRSARCASERGDRFVLSAREPLAFDRSRVHLRRPFMWGEPKSFTTRLSVETSSDGRRYSRSASWSVPGLNQTPRCSTCRTPARRSCASRCAS